MTQQSLSDLQAELAEIRQKVANLEAKQDNSKPTTNSARRRGFSKSLIFGLLALMGGLLLISTVLYGQGANPFALFIDKDGNVGIGTTEPKATLDVAGHLNVSDSATLSNAAITGSLMTRGNVGIGTVSPKANLDVQQGVRTGAHPDAVKGLYVTGDPGGVDDNAKVGRLSIRIGLGWAKSHFFTTGQCPVMKYNRALMNAILYDKVQIAKAVNVTVISLDQAPQGYKDFDKGAAKKFVIDPHGMLKK